MKMGAAKAKAKQGTVKIAAGVEDVEIDRRAIEASPASGFPIQMRKAAMELALSWSYEDAAEKAETTPDIVREWTQKPEFVEAVGWCVVGLADNQD